MNKQLNYKFKIYLTILLFFMLDICIYNLINEYIVNFLLCYLIILNLTKKISLFHNLFAIFLLMIQSFLQYSMVGLDIGIIFILILIANKTKKIVKHHSLLIFILLIIYFIGKSFILESLILKTILNYKKAILSFVLNYIICLLFLRFFSPNKTLNHKIS